MRLAEPATSLFNLAKHSFSLIFQIVSAIVVLVTLTYFRGLI